MIKNLPIKKLIFTVIILLILPTNLLKIYKNVKAQEISIGIATYLPISSEEEVSEGDIISIQNNEYKKSSREYDPNVIGVVVDKPAVAINFKEGQNLKAVLDRGDALVKVSTKNGDIEVGTLLTTSDIPGVAVKALAPGFIVGIAQEPYKGTDIGKIAITIQPHYSYSGNSTETGKFKTSIADIFTLSTLATYQSPSEVIKYSLAGIIILISFLVGFLTFGRVAANGIQAIGRNPLASKMIGISIILNVVVTVVIILAGLALSYFIISL